ncbi:CLUMA_CG007542, isoform A [Clunio marinus]|uniref:CLUMA_CG007542, isoform A n=1 Tax=Clunio marinus TaxID=568069 RepID=A0A1J1I6H9_9DIPT|nr:CLUMA_CG007542, isoform A [Clunio marinus]
MYQQRMKVLVVFISLINLYSHPLTTKLSARPFDTNENHETQIAKLVQYRSRSQSSIIFSQKSFQLLKKVFPEKISKEKEKKKKENKGKQKQGLFGEKKINSRKQKFS